MCCAEDLQQERSIAAQSPNRSSVEWAFRLIFHLLSHSLPQVNLLSSTMLDVEIHLDSLWSDSLLPWSMLTSHLLPALVWQLTSLWWTSASPEITSFVLMMCMEALRDIWEECLDPTRRSKSRLKILETRLLSESLSNQTLESFGSRLLPTQLLKCLTSRLSARSAKRKVFSALSITHSCLQSTKTQFYSELMWLHIQSLSILADTPTWLLVAFA